MVDVTIVTRRKKERRTELKSVLELLEDEEDTKQAKQPAPAQVGAISKAQNDQRSFKVTKYSLLQHANKIFEKSLTMQKTTERGTLWDFSTSILSQNSKN